MRWRDADDFVKVGGQHPLHLAGQTENQVNPEILKSQHVGIINRLLAVVRLVLAVQHAQQFRFE